MVACATVMKSLLLAATVVVLTGLGSAAEKVGDCCTKVSKKEMTEPILGYKWQRKSGHCVNAIIFQTETGWNCVKFNEPWVLAKIRELRLGARTTSLLNLITSSSSPPSRLPPFSSTMESITGPPFSSTMESITGPPFSSTMESITGPRSTQHTVQ